MGAEILAVIAGVVGVSLIAGSRVRARRRRSARSATRGWAPAVAGGTATFSTSAPATRWGADAPAAGAEFDDWHEDEPAPRPEPAGATAPRAAVTAHGPAGAPYSLEPGLDQLDEEDLDDVFAGRGSYAGAPLAPDPRDARGGVERPRGGAAGFRTAPRRSGLRGIFGSPAVRAAAYAALGIALVAVIVNVGLSGDGDEPAPAARPAPTAAAPPPVQAPAGPAPEQISAARDAAAAQRSGALRALAAAERRARAVERSAVRRRRAAAARRRRAAAARRSAPAPAPPPQPVQPPVPGTPAAPPAGGGSGGGSGGGGGSNCELGCIG